MTQSKNDAVELEFAVNESADDYIAHTIAIIETKLASLRQRRATQREKLAEVVAELDAARVALETQVIGFDGAMAALVEMRDELQRASE